MADGERYHVYGIGRFQGRLIVSMAGFRDSISAENLDFASLVMRENGQGWDSVDASPYLRMGTTQSPDSARFFFRKGVEWNGKFYAATSENVWSLDAGGRVWTKLPEIPRLIPCTRDYANMPVNDVTVHHGKLYVATNDETIFVLDGDSQTWSQIFTGDTANPLLGYSIYHNSPTLKVHSLVSDGKHLFVAGESPEVPMVYMGDYGEPYGNIPKGWRTIGSWCKNFLKFPLDKLDSAIADESDYR